MGVEFRAELLPQLNIAFATRSTGPGSLESLLPLYQSTKYLSLKQTELR